MTVAANRFRRNLMCNLLGTALPAAVALATVPVYLHLVGPARYGIVSVCWILLGYFGFMDFGLSRASANALSRLGSAGPAERGPVLVTALYLNVLLGAAAGLVLFLGGRLILRHAFDIPDGLRAETLRAVPWIAPMLPLGMVMGIATGALESRERFLTSNLFQATGTVLGQALPLLGAWAFGPTLDVVVPALLLARLLIVAASLATVFRLEWPVTHFTLHRGWARQLFGYGAWVSVSSLIGPVLDTLDQVLVGRMLGPVAIAHYAVPMNLAMRSQILATALSRTLFPRISREGVAAGRRIMARATVALVYVFGGLCAPAMILVGPFLEFWVGHDFARAARPVAELLMLGAWLNGVAFLPYTQLQAQGRPDLTARAHLAEALPFVGALWLLITVAGLPGAALAWTLRVGVDCAVLLALARCLHGVLLRALPALAGMLTVLAYAEVARPAFAPALAASVLAGTVFWLGGLLFEPALRAAAGHQLADLRTTLRRRLRVRPAGANG